MLKVKMVSTRVRTAAWWRTQRKPLGDVVAQVAALRGVAPVPGQRDAQHEQRAEGDDGGLRTEGPGRADREQRGPQRRAGELVDRDEAGLQP
jgi:hypothetical protein